MSSEEEAAVAVEDICCASCGIAAVDDVKLMDCDGGCDIVKYCSVTVKKIIENSTRKCANVTKIYSRRQMEAIGASVRFVACRCRFVRVNLPTWNAAAT